MYHQGFIKFIFIFHDLKSNCKKLMEYYLFVHIYIDVQKFIDIFQLKEVLLGCFLKMVIL
jgi:hypothetical protein